ncbi:MAG TPA: hypothetical protein VH475_06130 [Tepidisphaeraceae bacterium]|jgi:hypothetical protein
MLPTDDTYVPGYLISKAVEVVGAKRAAAFEVRPEPDGTDSLVLFRYFPPDERDAVTSRDLAHALRRYVMPCLAKGTDGFVEAPELAALGSRTFVLVFLAHQGAVLRGVTAMEVECPSQWEAQRRLEALQRIMG